MSLLTVLALDPGTHQTGYVVFDGRNVKQFGIEPNETILRWLKSDLFPAHDQVAIEMVACYGMAVGKEVFETCVWIGRFIERCESTVRLVYRNQVKVHVCGSTKAKDTNVRQALIDKYGPIGKKKCPGPLYGMTSHVFAALGVADYSLEVPVSLGDPSPAAR